MYWAKRFSSTYYLSVLVKCVLTCTDIKNLKSFFSSDLPKHQSNMEDKVLKSKLNSNEWRKSHRTEKNLYYLFPLQKKILKRYAVEVSETCLFQLISKTEPKESSNTSLSPLPHLLNVSHIKIRGFLSMVLCWRQEMILQSC